MREATSCWGGKYNPAVGTGLSNFKRKTQDSYSLILVQKKNPYLMSAVRSTWADKPLGSGNDHLFIDLFHNFRFSSIYLKGIDWTPETCQVTLLWDFIRMRLRGFWCKTWWIFMSFSNCLKFKWTHGFQKVYGNLIVSLLVECIGKWNSASITERVVHPKDGDIVSIRFPQIELNCTCQINKIQDATSKKD